MGGIICVPDRHARVLRLLDRTDPDFYRGTLAKDAKTIPEIITKKADADSISEFYFNYKLLPKAQYDEFLKVFKHVADKNRITKLTFIFRPFDPKCELQPIKEEIKEIKKEEKAEIKEIKKEEKQAEEKIKKEEAQAAQLEKKVAEDLAEGNLDKAEKDLQKLEKKVEKIEKKEDKIIELELEKKEVKRISIDEINLEAYKEEGIPDAHIQELFKILCTIGSLQRVNLNFEGIGTSNLGVFVTELAAFFNKRHVEKIDLNFEGLTFKKEEFSTLVQGLEHLEKLRKATINLRDAKIRDATTDADVCAARVGEFFKKNRNLRTLNLEWISHEDNKLKQSISLAILQGLKDKKHLHNFNTRLYLGNEDSVKALAELIQTAEDLFEINFANTSKTSPEQPISLDLFKSLCKALLTSATIKKINIGLRHIGLDDNCANHFAEVLSKNWKNLESGEFDLAENHRITDIGSEYATKVYQDIQKESFELHRDLRVHAAFVKPLEVKRDLTEQKIPTEKVEAVTQDIDKVLKAGKVSQTETTNN